MDTMLAPSNVHSDAGRRTIAEPDEALGAERQLDPSVEVDAARGCVTLRDLRLEDSAVVAFLAAVSPDRRSEEIRRAVAIGVRGITAMGIGVSADDVTRRVERAVDDALASARQVIDELLGDSIAALGEALDPDRRSSHTARTLEASKQLNDALLLHLDPDRSSSHLGRLVAQVEELLGPDGLLHRRLSETFDPHEEGSALQVVAELIADGFRDVREAIAREVARNEERELGTAKGVDYEDLVEDALRRFAAGVGGTVVERTAALRGELAGTSKVGDFTVATAAGHRIVVEAKNAQRLTLGGAGGILDELDRAMANRGAGAAVCVSRHEAFPAEVGVFAVYGNRVLVVDDGDGTMLGVALRWLETTLSAAGSATQPRRVDLDRLTRTAGRLRELGSRFSHLKRSLTEIRGGVDGVRGQLDQLREHLLDLVGDLDRELAPERRDGAIPKSTAVG